VKKHLFNLIKILGFLALWVVMIVLQSFPVIGEPVFTKGNSAIQRFWWELLPLICIVIVTLFFKIIVEKNKIKIHLLDNAVKNSIIGIIWGIVWIALPVLSLYIIKHLQFGAVNSVSFLYIWIISAILNVIMQEYLVRGYMFELLRKEYNIIISIIITSIIFTLFHAGAFLAGIIPVLSVFTMSIFVSLLLVYTKALLAPIIVHAVWNIIGSLLGCVSLGSDYPVLINCTTSGNNIISGGIYKLEGSIFTLLVNIINIIVLIFLLKNDINKNKSNAAS